MINAKMKTYRSRISSGLVGFVAMTCIISFIVPVFVQKAYHACIIPILIFAIVLIAMRGIKYVIDGETLKIYYFWGIHQDIDIKTIRKIEPSHCLLSSPAASLKRIAIHYNKYDVVYISPRNQEDFIQTISEITNLK